MNVLLTPSELVKHLKEKGNVKESMIETDRETILMAVRGYELEICGMQLRMEALRARLNGTSFAGSPGSAVGLIGNARRKKRAKNGRTAQQGLKTVEESPKKKGWSVAARKRQAAAMKARWKARKALAKKAA
jgi:hypothetical protein